MGARLSANTIEKTETKQVTEEQPQQTSEPVEQTSQAVSTSEQFVEQTTQAAEQVSETSSVTDEVKVRKLTVLHFNDAYHIEASNGVAGAASFKTACLKYKDENPLILCGGDIFNPSSLSTITRGKHMCKALNLIGLHYSVVGNHDLDFGVDRLVTLIDHCNNKWLLSNLFDKQTDKPLAGALPYDLTEWNGIKIGLIGLVEESWIQTLGRVDPETVRYVDYIEEGKRLAKELKEKGAELVFALTHVRLDNDIALANQVPEIDAIIGGHDHFYDCRIENGVALLKSGVDFQQLTVLKITLLEGFKPQFQITTHDIFEKDYPEDPEVAEYVKEVSGELEKKMGKTVANLVCEIDTRTPLIRRKESPIGNLIADALNGCSGTDLAFINGGSIRSDAVYPAGHFKLKDLMSIFPFEDVCVGIEVTGQDLMDALENSVSRVPEEEGKFPVLSGGVKVVFDSSLEPGSRIKSAELNGEPIDLLKTYKVATKAYMNDGKDGYTSFMNKPYVIDHESGQMLSTVFRNYLRQQQVVAALQETQEQKAVRLLRKEKGFYAKLNPVVEGRIVDLNEKQ